MVGAVGQPQTVAPATAPAAATPFRPKPDAMPGEEEPGEAPEGELDEDDFEGSMSLAAIEAELTRSIADQAHTIRIPVHVIETINKIVRTSRQMLPARSAGGGVGHRVAARPGGGAVTYRHARSTGTGSVYRHGLGVRLRAVTAVAAVPGPSVPGPSVYGRSA
jgi:hypothetical protein